MTLRARRRATAAFGIATIAALWMLDVPVRESSQPLVFALQVSSPDGQVLGSPLVVGAPGQTVRIRLMCESDPEVERLSITLDPDTDASVDGEGGALRYEFELSVAGRFDRTRGTIELSLGDERHVDIGLDDPARGVRFAVYAAPVSHPGVESFLQARKLRLARGSS